MSNFIRVAYGVVNKAGIDTADMSTDEVVAKFKELSGGEKGWGDKAYGDKMKKTKPFNIPNIEESLKKDFKGGKITIEEVASELAESGITNYIDIDYAKKIVGEKKEGLNKGEQLKTDKYGNKLLDKKTFDAGVKAGKEYVDSQTKYVPIDKLIKSNVFPRYLMEFISDGIKETNYKNDLTYTDFDNIVENLTGYKFDSEAYETNKGSWEKYFTKK